MMEAAPTEATAAPAGPSLKLTERQRWEILGALFVGLFLSALDQTIVGTALPRIVTELDGLDLYVWVTTAYLLTATISGPFYGKLSDLYGRKPLLMIGITIFIVGSILSALSQEMWQLVLARGVQGLGAGALFPLSLAIIGDIFTPAERGKYQGVFGGVFGIAALVGPALGGFLTEQLSWHWIFLINVPIGLAALLVIGRVLPNLRRPGLTHSLDYLGAAVFTFGVSMLLIGLTNKQTGDWTDLSVGGLIVAGLAVLAAFLFIESRAKEPIVPLNLWRNRTYAASMVAVFLLAVGFFGAVVFLPLWFQTVQGSSPTESGYQVLPLLVGLIASSVVAGLLVSRTGRYKMILVVAVVFLAAGLAMLTQLRADTPLPVLWVWMFVTGLGIGPTLSVYTIVVQNAVAVRDLGAATSNLTFFRQVGGSVGLAVVGTVFGSTLREEAPRQLVSAGVPQQFVDQFVASGLDGNGLAAVGGDLGQQILAALPAEVRPIVEPLIPAIVDGIHQAISIAVANTFVIGVVATGAAFVATLFVRELPLRSATPVEVESRRPDRSEPARLAEAPVTIE
jgi:EmrB/QacA subfamily drug resistance transporter